MRDTWGNAIIVVGMILGCFMFGYTVVRMVLFGKDWLK